MAKALAVLAFIVVVAALIANTVAHFVTNLVPFIE
jgi:hypothetical protein